MRVASLIFATILLPLALAACGGGSDGSFVNPPPSNQVLVPGPSEIRTCPGGAPCY